MSLSDRSRRVLLALGITAAAALAAWIIAARVNAEALQQFLARRESLFLGATLFTVFASALAGADSIIALFKGLDRRAKVALVCLLLISLAVRLAAPPRTHRIYFDEDIYLNIAQSMASTGYAHLGSYGSTEFGEYRCAEGSLNKQPNGWPYLVSLLFCITGVSEQAASLLTVTLSTASILLCFMAGALLFNSTVGLWAALVFSLIPTAVQWSVTAASEPAIVFFTALGVVLLLLHERDGSPPLLCAGLFSLLFAAQMRPEGVVLLLLALPFIVRSPVRTARIAALLAAAGVILVPHLTHLIVFRGEDWGSPDGMKFSLSFIAANVRSNGLFFLSGVSFPAFFTFLAILGAALRQPPRRKQYLALWLFLGFSPYLPFYAGSYEYGADVRFALPVFIPLSLLAGAGCKAAADLAELLVRDARRAAVLVMVLLASIFCAYLPSIRAVGEESWDARTDHDFIVRAARKIPDGAYVFTNNPCVVLLAGKGALQASYALDREFVRSLKTQAPALYLYRDYWSWLSPQKEEFARLEQSYILRAVSSVTRKDRTFALYRIVGEREAPDDGQPSRRSDGDTR